MLNLVDNNDLIDLVTSAAVAIDVAVAFDDFAASALTAGKQLTAISTATTTTIVSAPSSGSRRVKTINIRAKSTTTPCDVTVRLNDNGSTIIELFKTTLDPGEVLTYCEGVGWFVYEASYPLGTKVALTADLAAWTTTTLADATGLVLPVLTGLYYRFKFLMLYQAAATTTGIKVAVTIPSATAFSAIADLPTSTAADGTANIYRGYITASADAVVGTGTPAAATTHLAELEGLILPAADGNVQLQGASEVAASNVTLKQGSVAILERIA